MIARRGRVKLKGRQLKDAQDKIAVVNFAIEKALTDTFLRQEIYELLDSARDCGQDLERMLMP